MCFHAFSVQLWNATRVPRHPTVLHLTFMCFICMCLLLLVVRVQPTGGVESNSPYKVTQGSSLLFGCDIIWELPKHTRKPKQAFFLVIIYRDKYTGLVIS